MYDAPNHAYAFTFCQAPPILSHPTNGISHRDSSPRLRAFYSIERFMITTHVHDIRTTTGDGLALLGPRHVNPCLTAESHIFFNQTRPSHVHTSFHLHSPWCPPLCISFRRLDHILDLLCLSAFRSTTTVQPLSSRQTLETCPALHTTSCALQQYPTSLATGCLLGRCLA